MFQVYYPIWQYSSILRLVNFLHRYRLAQISLVGLFFLLPWISGEHLTVHAAVVINEILPRADAPFIELYNNGDTSVTLDRWTVKHSAGDQKSFMFNASNNIGGKSFLMLTPDQTGITLSAEGDTVSLIDEKNNTVDQQSYISTIGYNTSMGRSTDGGGSWVVCNTPATPSLPNNCPPPPTPLPTVVPTAVPTDAPTAIPTDVPLPPSPTNQVSTLAPSIAPLVSVTPAVLGVTTAATSGGTSPDDNRKFMGLAMVLISAVWVVLIGLYAVTRRK